jgi:serine protease Do
VPVKSVEQVKKIVDDSKKAVALLIRRDGNTIFIPVHFG